MEKETTIDTLARIIKEAFERVHERFDQTVSKDEFREVKKQLDRIEYRHVNRIERLESDVYDLRRDVGELQGKAGIGG